jgi:hypothetical protein
MCPACWSMVAMVVAGAGSVGGLTAIAVKKVRSASAVQVQACEAAPQTSTTEEERP